MNRTWAPYEAGEHVEDAGLRIVKILRRGGTQATTSYVVQYDCCGLQNVKSHKAIQKRINARHRNCVRCGRKRSANSRRGASREIRSKQFLIEPWYHGWEPPASVVAKTPRWL